MYWYFTVVNQVKIIIYYKLSRHPYFVCTDSKSKHPPEINKTIQTSKHKQALLIMNKQSTGSHNDPKSECWGLSGMVFVMIVMIVMYDHYDQFSFFSTTMCQTSLGPFDTSQVLYRTVLCCCQNNQRAFS